MDIRLTGRSALITGASQGLGLAMALRFAESGAGVAMIARREGPLAEAEAAVRRVATAPVLTIQADVTRAGDLTAAFQTAEGALGQIDILVNNAGGGRAGPFESITDEDWQADLDLKLFAAIRLMRLSLPGMRARRWGRIINVLNSAARTPGARSGPSSVTRAAGLALTKAIASEVAPDNVLVNALLPGAFATEQMRRRKSADVSEADHFAAVGQRVPLGRVGRPEEFANLACFLCSDEGGYVTGAGINIDGGTSPAP